LAVSPTSPSQANAAPQTGAPVHAIRAGKIHTLGPAGVIENGTLLVQAGRVLAVGGKDLDLPAGAVLIDFGAGAEIVPGFVAADSRLAEGAPSPRTAAPGLSALEAFDGFRPYMGALSAGVTSAYITPARGRLIAGQGAVVKLAGEQPDGRVVKSPAAIHGAISAEARNTPGYWEPPVPATADVGLGRPEEQLPRSAVGALLARRRAAGLRPAHGARADPAGLGQGPLALGGRGGL
jgi:hypothetical protein